MKFIALCVLAACTSSKPAEHGPPTAERGKQVYMANCVVCHSGDPSKDGPLGPAIKGSSKELLEARIMRGAYPEGYKPKRDTKAMLPLPHVKPDLDDLVEFLK